MYIKDSMEYKVRCGELSPQQLAAFNHTGYSEKFIRLLVQRGLDTPEKAAQFFDFDPAHLHDPLRLKGMAAAVARLQHAISQKQRILIIGDYDADGICATAILYKYLLTKHVRTAYFLPERDADGYGLNVGLVDRLAEKYRPQLLITVDCGISCATEIAHAQSLGIDCIVTDHHAIPAVTPDCICVDPKFTDQDYPFNDLCGAGVALKLIQAMEGLEVAQKYFDICTIATVADIVSLTDENRIIVHHGLKMLNQGTVPGISALAKACNIRDEIRSSDISFRLGPKINASGRMGNAKRGLDVILEQDPTKIEHIVKSLLYLNTKRQELCTTIYEAAVREIEAKHLQDQPAIIVARPEWSSGVLGIVAVRITEKYGRPCIVLGGTGDVYKGSGRSLPGINLVQCITQVADTLLTFGGHAMAAGLSLKVEQLDAFRSQFLQAVTQSAATNTVDNNRYYDFAIDSSELNEQFFHEVEQLEPTGCGNPAPVFMTVMRHTTATTMISNANHTKFANGLLKFLYFGGAGFNEILAADCEKSIIFELQQSTGTTPRAIVKCVIPFAINAEEQAMVLQRYLQDELVVPPDSALQQIIHDLTVDRLVFIDYYKAIIALTQQHLSGQSLVKLFPKLDLPGKNLFQFVFCAAVFQDLGILSYQRQTWQVNNIRPTELCHSKIYRKISEQNNKE